MSKKYQDRDWLEEKWLQEDLSKEEISEICSVSERTIRHYLNEEFSDIGNYDCEKCKKSFKYERGLNYHITTVHENESANNAYMDNSDRKHKDSEWLQEKLEQGCHYNDIAEMCTVGVDSIRKVIREENLGTHYCYVDGCEERYPTEGGLKQHLSRDHPDVEYEGYGLDLDHVQEKSHKARMEKVERGVDQYNKEKMMENLEKAHEEFDGNKHSEFMKEVWENKDPEDYPVNQDSFWPKYMESRDDWGPKQIEVEETGNVVASSWEEKVDLILHESDVDYVYEGNTYEIGNTWNTPDFEGKDWIIEVKGYAGFRNKDRYEMIGNHFVEEVDKTYILVAGENVDMPCDVRIEWEEREKLFDVLS
jgi:hypothetical protein